MPWKVVKKTYGKDPQIDSFYHLQYISSQFQIDITCYYLEGYKWFMKCDRLGIDHILLGEIPKMDEYEAKKAAIQYLTTELGYITEHLITAGKHTTTSKDRFTNQ